MQCLKCGAERNLKDLQCPECGVFYAKAEAALLKKQQLETERLEKERLKQEAEEKKQPKESPETLNSDKKIESKKTGCLQIFVISFIAVSNNKDMLNNIKSLKNQSLKVSNHISAS